MLSKIYSSALIGLEAEKVTVEVDLGKSVHHFIIVGLPDAAVSESKERVNLAIKNSNATPPYYKGRLVINLAPADIRKEGPSYDLPIAVGFLKSSGQIEFDSNNKMFMGELALDGTTRVIDGVLPRAILAKKIGIEELFVPFQNAKEAALVKGLKVFPIKSLSQLIKHFQGEEIEPYSGKNKVRKPLKFETDNRVDFVQIKGQNQAKRALEIAAAGGHNILMNGPPGSGKTMLAKALATILPEMTEEEKLEVTKIYSVSGRLVRNEGLISTRPFRSPHHTASGVSLVGGGSVPKPGEISLAHRGVLFLDELPEFDRKVLESLRQPLEDGDITITRAGGVARYPSEFILVASMNPCPCGFLSDENKECTCSQPEILRYQKSLSGPLIDRIDICIEVPRLSYEKIRVPSQKKIETSRDIRQRVERARQIQNERYQNESFISNAEINSKSINKYCPLSPEGEAILKQAIESIYLSGRSINRILKVARTIADLAGAEKILPEYVAEAVQYRKGILGQR